MGIHVCKTRDRKGRPSCSHPIIVHLGTHAHVHMCMYMVCLHVRERVWMELSARNAISQAGEERGSTGSVQSDLGSRKHDARLLTVACPNVGGLLLQKA